MENAEASALILPAENILRRSLRQTAGPVGELAGPQGLSVSLPDRRDGHSGKLSDRNNYSPLRYLSQKARLASEKCRP